MPTYQYKCTSCLHEFEEFQSMSDDALLKCPECKKQKLVRVISGAGLVFKGSGFYLTDYKKRGTQPDGGNPSKNPDQSGSAGGGEEKSDAKKKGGTEHPASDGGEKKEKVKKNTSGDKPSGRKT